MPLAEAQPEPEQHGDELQLEPEPASSAAAEPDERGAEQPEPEPEPEPECEPQLQRTSSLDWGLGGRQFELLVAAERGDLVEVQAQLGGGGADVNELHPDDGISALHEAAFHGHTAVLECLLAAGAAIDQTNGDGWTALMMSAANGQTAALNLLLDRGASRDTVATAGDWTDQTVLEIAENTAAFREEVLGEKVTEVETKAFADCSALLRAPDSRHSAVAEMQVVAAAPAAEAEEVVVDAETHTAAAAAAAARQVVESPATQAPGLGVPPAAAAPVPRFRLCMCLGKAGA
eukprot:COSAG06_NODE_3623_length_5105_cov_2.312225_2_plen_290_part_00